MAKLHNYYVLCPLIDQKSFLGVAEIPEDEHVIVTLGRNVVNKYRLSDQKQISGWTSRDHITAPVIYDAAQNKYVGVFNNNTVKMWPEDSTNLDKLKKLKFPINILRLVPRNSTTLIIFSNGNTASLPYAIENRKTYESKSLLRDTDKILDVYCWTFNSSDYICFVVKTESGLEIVSSTLRAELGDLDRSSLHTEKVVRHDVDDAFVVGQLVCKNSVYILWNDAKLSEYDIHSKRWKTIGSVPWISTTSATSMAKIGTNHIILFGNNKDQEGAILVAYNYSLGVGSCRYPMKLYREHARIYRCHNRIVLEASNHIGMLPYTLETKGNLSSLLGSHDIVVDESPEVANWNITANPTPKLTSFEQNTIRLGITERKAGGQIIPDLIKQDQYEELASLLMQFRDLPESVIGILFKYAINRLNPENQDFTSNNFKDSFDDIDEEELRLLNSICRITVCDAFVISHLREALSVDESLFLLWYISRLLFETEEPLNLSEESRLCDWLTLIMDAFYQQYLISKEEKVSKVLASVRKLVIEQIKGLHHCDKMISEIQKLKTAGTKNVAEKYYTIEIMHI